MNQEVRLAFTGEGSGFQVERWMIPLDHRVESITRLALCWTSEDESQKVVLLNRKAAQELADECLSFIKECD